jgi:hypothetical protein
METTLFALDEIVRGRPHDQQLQIFMCEAAGSAISAYGKARNFEALERWGERLHALTERWQEDAAIQLQGAIGAYNACVNYSKAGFPYHFNRWREQLAVIARRMAFDAEIQEVASRLEVAFAQQSS